MFQSRFLIDFEPAWFAQGHVWPRLGEQLDPNTEYHPKVVPNASKVIKMRSQASNELSNENDKKYENGKNQQSQINNKYTTYIKGNQCNYCKSYYCEKCEVYLSYFYHSRWRNRFLFNVDGQTS